MTNKQKSDIAKICAGNYGLWTETYYAKRIELSNKHPYMCVCGRLATGLHESWCIRFADSARILALKELSGEAKQCR